MALRRKRPHPHRGARRPRIMAVNLYHGGHHPQHLHSLLTHWEAHYADTELHMVLSEAYRREHPALLNAVDASAGAHRHLVRTPALRVHRRGLFASDRTHGRVVSQWAEQIRADHVLLMYFDHVQLSLALNLRFAWPVNISGIFFRPTFHYQELGMHLSFREHIAAIRKEFVLASALRNPHLRYVFCFDPLAVERFAKFRTSATALTLPEPLYDPSPRAEEPPLLRSIEPGRRRLLMFGSLDERKGISPVLDALSLLSESDQSRLVLVLAGRLSDDERDRLLRRIQILRSTSNVQIVVDDRYLEETEIQPLMRACDLVLLTYIRHVGSSGVLVRAARASVPVLSTAYGLLGVQVSQNRLGAIVDATSPVDIASTLKEWLVDPNTIPFDRETANVFANANTADAFAQTILSQLLEARS